MWVWDCAGCCADGCGCDGCGYDCADRSSDADDCSCGYEYGCCGCYADADCSTAYAYAHANATCAYDHADDVACDACAYGYVWGGDWH